MNEYFYFLLWRKYNFKRGFVCIYTFPLSLNFISMIKYSIEIKLDEMIIFQKDSVDYSIHKVLTR